MRHLSVTSEPLSSPGQTRLVTFSLFSFPHHSISPQHRELKLEKPACLRLHILRRQCCLPAVAAFIFPQIPEEKRSTIVSPLWPTLDAHCHLLEKWTLCVCVCLSVSYENLDLSTSSWHFTKNVEENDQMMMRINLHGSHYTASAPQGCERRINQICASSHINLPPNPSRVYPPCPTFDANTSS